MTWNESTLGDICDAGQGIIKTGPFGSQLHQSDYSDAGTPVVMPKDIVGGRVSESSIARVAEEHVERLSHHQLYPGDIVYGRRGDIGRCALVTPRESGWLCGTGCLRIHLGNGEVSPKFLFYFLNNPSTVDWIYNQAVGATMPNLNTGILRSIPVRYPARETQERIAAFLSAYDDLIENNTRRIEILEEMARRLYEEWFVHFRFPGHEEAEKEWRTVPFASVLSKHIGGGWGKEEVDTQHVESGYVIRGTDIPGARRLSVEKCPYRFHKAPNIKSRRLEPGNIVMEVSGGSHDQSVGRALYVSSELLGSFDDDVICASFCKRLVVDQALIHPILVYYHLDEAYRSKRVDEFQVQSTGIKNFQFKAFLEKEVVSIPPQDLQEKFVDMVSPVIRQHQNLSRKNANLRAQRDLLLPKLVSGEIDVSDIPMPDNKEVKAA